jgi:DNA-binding transcriptional MerR regulator
MAQDFHAAFQLGNDDRRISTIDADGVALAAIKGLIAELESRQQRSAEQARRLAELESELATLAERLAAAGR